MNRGRWPYRESKSKRQKHQAICAPPCRQQVSNPPSRLRDTGEELSGLKGATFFFFLRMFSRRFSNNESYGYWVPSLIYQMLRGYPADSVDRLTDPGRLCRSPLPTSHARRLTRGPRGCGGRTSSLLLKARSRADGARDRRSAAKSPPSPPLRGRLLYEVTTPPSVCTA